MECTHIGNQINSILDRVRMTDFKFQCAECRTSQSLWLCMSCGVIRCGRYVNGHMVKHYEMNKDHILSMSVETASLYCYKCNDDIEPNRHNNYLDWLRRYIVAAYERHIDKAKENNNNDIVNGNDKNSETSSVSMEEKNELRILRLRPRKRLNSEDENKSFDRTGNTQRRKKSTKEIKKNQVKKAVGLRNLGNTCFMNAVLQSLNNIHPFALYIKKLPSFENVNSSSTKKCNNVRHTRNTKDIDDVVMAEELRKILLSLNEAYEGVRKNAISPESLFFVIWKVVPRFRGYQQQDAHEFLRYMLDRLHTELLLLLPEFSLNIGYKGRSTIVSCVFGGLLQSEVVCLNCSSVSKKQDPFLDLSLDIPDKYLQRHLPSKRQKNAEENTAPCRIHDCLSSFIDIEELAETELYYCNNCKGKQRSTKRFWIRRLPNVLCLHLKRFRWTNYYRTKIDTTVVFPVESLDMTDFVLRDIRGTRQSGIGCCLYDLAAVIVHHGSGVGSGHYTAFAVHNGEWFHFNDSSVEPISRETVEKCKPYILFYIRKEVRLPKLFSS